MEALGTVGKPTRLENGRCNSLESSTLSASAIWKATRIGPVAWFAKPGVRKRHQGSKPWPSVRLLFSLG